MPGLWGGHRAWGRVPVVSHTPLCDPSRCWHLDNTQGPQRWEFSTRILENPRRSHSGSGMSPLLWLGGFGTARLPVAVGSPRPWGDLKFPRMWHSELPAVASCGSELFCGAFCSLEFSHVQ